MTALSSLPQADTGTAIDVRSVPPPQRHPLIFGSFDALAPGEHFEILNDHDPLPLYYQFERVRSGQFDWLYLQQGPVVWQVRISRLMNGEASGQPVGCAGHCHCSE